MSETDGYEPVKSTAEATLWLRRFHPERLGAWLDGHEPKLRAWISRVRPPGYVYPPASKEQ